MKTESQLRETIQKIRALFERAGSEGEKIAAEAALSRLNRSLKKARKEEPLVEMQFSLRDYWSRRLFLALCRSYSLDPYRYKGQRHNTVMLRVKKSFVNEILWPEFVKINTTLSEYLNSITDRIIAEEINGSAEEAEEVNETLQLTE